MRSRTLNRLQVEYEIEYTPGDGDCFYTAVSKQLMSLFDVSSLRNIVAEHLREEDVELFNAINDTSFTLQKLRREVRKLGNIWADSIEINALLRSIPRLCIYIIDDEYESIHKICHEDKNLIPIYLRRENLHYESIRFKEKDCMKILKTMENIDTFSMEILNEKKVHVLLFVIIIVIPCVLITVKLLDYSLKDWHKVCTKEI